MEGIINVVYTNDPKKTLEKARSYLYQDKVNNNIFISILEERINVPQEGNYWCVEQNGQVIGFALQSPTNFQINVSEMQENALIALTLKIHEQALKIPALFATIDTLNILEKIWKTTFSATIIPAMHLQYYFLNALKVIAPHNAEMRSATPHDFEKVKKIILNFYAEIHEDVGNIDDMVLRDIQSNLIWILVLDNKIVCLLRYAEQAHSTVRIKNVYTPNQYRNKGYGVQLVSLFCQLKKNSTITLYTDAVNIAANHLYYKIGFQLKNDWAKYSVNYN